MKKTTSPPAAGKPVDWLQHQWVIAGVVASAARFVPVPFVDDIIRNQCRRFVVARTLAASGTPFSTESFKPLYSEPGGLLAKSLGALAKVPLKVIVFPVRKVVAIATSVHGVPMEIMKAVLLGRTLRRLLASGDVDPGRAVAMQSAFDDAFARMDFRAVRAALVDALRSVRSWKTSAIISARRLASRRSPSDETLPADDQVEATAATVEEVLERPETTRLFAQFDQRFDQAYARASDAASDGKASAAAAGRRRRPKT